MTFKSLEVELHTFWFFQPEDEQEKFDRLQMELLMNNPDSAAYYNAQMRTQRRVS